MPWFLRHTMVLNLVTFVVYLFIFWRISSNWSKNFNLSKIKLQIPMLGILLWAYFFTFQALYLYFRDSLSRMHLHTAHLTWQDYIFYLPNWIASVICLEIIPYLILLWLVYLIMKFRPVKSRFPRWGKTYTVLQTGIVIFFIFYVSWNIHTSSNQIRVQVCTIKAPALKGKKTVFIGDLHVDRYTGKKKLAQINQQLNRIEPDILLFSGDLISRGQAHIPQALKFMCDLAPDIQKFAVMGDHDYWYGRDKIPRGLKRCGWKFLENRHHLMDHQGSKILITGITEIYSRRIPASVLTNLFKAAPAADYKILLVHQPREHIVHLAEKHRYHLVLAGHSHGGQIAIHLLGIPLSVARLESPFYKGEYQYKNLKIITTHGIGFTLAPIRYHVPAEIVVINPTDSD